MFTNKYHTLRELKSYKNVVPELNEVMDYINFASETHPEKGAPGRICPFLLKAIKDDTIYCSIVETDNFTEKHLNEIVVERVKYFLEISEGKKYKNYYTMILVFLNINQANYEEMLIKVHTNFKRKLVYEGLLIGEFYPENNNHGLYSKKFFPLKSKVPMLAIRYLIQEDLPFLIKEDLPDELRIDFIEGYLHTLGDNISLKNLESAQNVLNSLNKINKKKKVLEGLN